MATETWVLNENIVLPANRMDIEFESNNQYFAAIDTGIMYSENYLSYIDVDNDDTFVYEESTNKWVNSYGTNTSVYRTITFSVSPTGDLLVWLQTNGTKQAAPQVTVDLTSLSGYESLPAGTYALAVKAKAANYQDSDLSQTVSFTKLAAPVATAADTTVTWDAITNAESYDVYVDGELYENTTGAVTYDITTTVTNGTYSGDTTITDTATITITADSGYKLPDTVTVTGASQTWNKETGTLTLSNPTGSVTVSAVCAAAVTYPVKGDLITLDSKQYRVLKIDGSVAEVLAMYDASTSQKFDTNSSHNNTYAGKNIDTYCNNTFYSGLSASMKNAIVDKTFTQDSWRRYDSVPTDLHYTGKDTNGDLYFLMLFDATYGESITRHCYCLSVQDVLDYLECTTSMGTSDTTLTGTNVLQMFWNVTATQSGKYNWLSSAFSDNYSAFYVSGGIGYLSIDDASNTNAVRPAFQIDLSKIEWTPVGG